MNINSMTIGSEDSEQFARSRIALVQTQAENGGAQEISRILGRGLEARGYDVHHCFLYRRTEAFDAAPNTIFCASERPRGPVAIARSLLQLQRYLRKLKPDAVMTFQHYGNLLGAPIARAAGVRTVVANQNTAKSMLPRLVVVADTVLGTAGVYSHVITNSADTDKDFGHRNSRYDRRTIRIDHGFDPKTSSLSKAEARRSFGLPEGVPLLGNVGRLHVQKNQQLLVELLPHEPSWHLALLGQGRDRADLEALAERLGCRERVHILGEVAPAQVGTFLNALDAFVFPSIAETFGLAVVEAAQAGVPVVASDLPVLREVLKADGVPCALFAGTGDMSAFLSAARRVINEPATAAALVAAGQSLRNRYSLEAMTDGYEKLLQDEGIFATRR